MSTNMTLLELRTATRQRADMVNSSGVYTNSFVTDNELTSYINQSYFELYDLLVTVFEDYYLAPPLSFSTTGVSQLYPLPDGVNYTAAPKFYKMLGVDLSLNGSANARVTIKKFDFLSRNRYVYPQLTSTYLGVFNLRYRVVGSNIMFIPNPSGGQVITLWYVPALTTLVLDADVADGISGWTEYIITDAAIKCGQKEETDVSVLELQKAALIKRIEDSAMNRDAGSPDTISESRSRAEAWGGGWGPNGDGGYGGW